MGIDKKYTSIVLLISIGYNFYLKKVNKSEEKAKKSLTSIINITNIYN